MTQSLLLLVKFWRTCVKIKRCKVLKIRKIWNDVETICSFLSFSMKYLMLLNNHRLTPRERGRAPPVLDGKGWIIPQVLHKSTILRNCQRCRTDLLYRSKNATKWAFSCKGRRRFSRERGSERFTNRYHFKSHHGFFELRERISTNVNGRQGTSTDVNGCLRKYTHLWIRISMDLSKNNIDIQDLKNRELSS